SYYLKKYTKIENTSVFLEIGCTGSITKPVGIVKWSYPVGGQIDEEKIRQIAMKILSADVDLKPFYQKLNKSVKLKPMIKSLYGLKPILTATTYESAAWAIIGQQINLTFAGKVKMRLERKYGKSIKYGKNRYYLFPDPQKIVRARIATLKKMQFSLRKAEYLIGLSKVCVKHNDFFDSLTDMPYQEAIDKLITVRGIGVWSANYLLMRGVGHLNCLPLGDTGLTRATKEVYNMRTKPDNEKIEKLARKFDPYRSLYTLYLWFTLN
ncbi:MAG: DNA-3-methyladenine glycosylase 2 family protein, partial [candidate division Zixibacteria bacterium]|nr:DNA-3-methyladenine glycosylase 2 family protein [candidate division Zixibacteria bacterium]